MNVAHQQIEKQQNADLIAKLAIDSLLEEAYLTPKPGLVDFYNNGCHHDLSLSLLEASALSLKCTFHNIALTAIDKQPSQFLRVQLAAIGRYGEQQMMQATGNINSHKGAIWCLGLLTAATSMLLGHGNNFTKQDILKSAGIIAAFDDRYAPKHLTNGDGVRRKYMVVSAREEAILGFPAMARIALPAWEKYQHESEQVRRLNVLLALMAVVDDTCILHRSDMEVLRTVQQKAKFITDNGGLGVAENWILYRLLDLYINEQWVSPGGSADLLAATIFIHKVTDHFKIN
jgi:triphosphoribosyl-dephospho-CoA synthase